MSNYNKNSWAHNTKRLETQIANINIIYVPVDNILHIVTIA